MDDAITPATPPPSTSRAPEPETVRKTKPGLKRFILTLTVLFSFLIGLPFLLKSVEIYRSPLPFREIDDLSSAIESNPVQFPCKFHAVFVNFQGNSLNSDELKLSIEDAIRKLTGVGSHSCGSCSYNSTVSLTLESNNDCTGVTDGDLDLKCGALSELKRHDFSSGEFKDELFDEYLHSLLKDSSSGAKVYTVFVVRKEEDNKVKEVVGKYRHAWIVGRVSEEDTVRKVAEIFVKAFMNGGKEEGTISGEFMPVGSDGKIVLSFNLLNADPHDWVYDWDFQKIDDHFLVPVVEALKPVADITVESQILYHTPKSSFSYWDDKLGSYIFHTNDLPFFVNSNEWHLDTSIAAGGRSKVLHFVVYVPSAAECPLLLQVPTGEISSTNGFISPMWGSVIVWNPSACSKDSEIVQHLRHNIPSEELTKIFEVFVGQLRQLFGLKSEGILGHTSGTVRLLTSERGFTEWELDVLSRQHTCFNLHQCGTTLGSLSRLVQSLPRMIIKDEIGKQVKYSLEAAKSALSNASHGVYNASVVSSRQARSLAEDAFYHPSMMSVSYYSFEHCFAVYSPFFLPVSLHVLLAVLREWKRYKQETKKYRSSKAKRD